MSKYKAMVIIVKCEECGYENAQLLPLEISEVDWKKNEKNMVR